MTHTDSETDPTSIDWPARQRSAAIPYIVYNGRPINPFNRTGRLGQGGLWHWGEQLCADALVAATDREGHRWIVMIERKDGHGWALPGGHVDPGENALDAAIRELYEETGLDLPGARWVEHEPQHVPDPRATDEAWMVTVLATTHLGRIEHAELLPVVTGGDDAARAAWVQAGTYASLADHLRARFGGEIFEAHREMLAYALRYLPLWLDPLDLDEE